MAVVIQEMKVCHHHCSCHSLKISKEYGEPWRANLQAFTLFLFQNWEPSLTFSFVCFTQQYFYLLVLSWSQHGISVFWAEKIYLSDQLRCCFPRYLKTTKSHKEKPLQEAKASVENAILLIRVILFRLTNFLFLLKTRPHKVCSCCHLIYPLGSTDKFLFPLCVHFIRGSTTVKGKGIVRWVYTLSLSYGKNGDHDTLEHQFYAVEYINRISQAGQKMCWSSA